jgi:putative PEP-CTERM system histidine kinase
MAPVDFFYTLNVLVLFSGLLGLRLPTSERLFSVYLLQSLAGLPLLAGVYVYGAFNMRPGLMPLVFFSESVFAYNWCAGAYWLHKGVVGRFPDIKKTLWPGLVLRLGVLGAGIYSEFRTPLPDGLEEIVILPRYGIYFSGSFFLLLAAAAMAWQLEHFWHKLPPSRRWAYKYLLVGNYVICGALGWISSYRLTFFQAKPAHFMLAGILMVFGWSLIGYAVGRHRLLNHQLYVSRKIFYTAVAPMAFGVYLIGLGGLTVLMRYLDLPMSFVLRWFLVVAGLALVAVFALSRGFRRRVKFFISTHFYINKYEYRDEWMALSRRLQGVLNEDEIIAALALVLGKSLYTDVLCIWVGDEDRGYKPALRKGIAQNSSNEANFRIPPDDPLVRYLKTHEHYYCRETADGDAPNPDVSLKKNALVSELNLELFVPMISGDRLVGLIGLGPEFSGGPYSHDDFDLLLALGTQAAAALQAGRMADALSRVRQQEAWNIMSSFVLHDVKNAASMLSLIRQNAAGHLGNPEFQQDLLDTIEDALKRMGKVQSLLGSLKGEMKPVLEKIELCKVLRNGKRDWSRRLPGLDIAVSCDPPIVKKTDTRLLLRVMENLLLNALEAGGPGIRIDIACRKDAGGVTIEVRDNGPGVPPEMLPDALFEPFITSKAKGSGVGLWQAKRLVDELGGDIRAANSEIGGASFVIRLGS